MRDNRTTRRTLLRTVPAAALGVSSVTAAHGNETASVVEVEDWYDLDDVRDDLDDEYALADDLDAETAGYDAHVADPDDGWEPIGDVDDPFTGTFSGGGYEIADLTIARPDEDEVGLFGVSEGVVEQADIVDCDVTGDLRVGGLVGENGGTVSSVAVSGSVSASGYVGALAGWNLQTVSECSTSADVDGNDRVGGLVGEVDTGTIVDSSASGVVTGADRVGGLLGRNDGGTVTSTYATGDVTGNSAVGGFIGQNDGTVSECSASGGVDGDVEVGGLVGSNSETVSECSATGDADGDVDVGGLLGSNAGTVTSTYAAGAVSGDSDVGGLVGTNADATIQDSYWDTEATGRDLGIGDGGGDATGLTTTEMQGETAEDTMTGFDFQTVWTTTTGYPTLQFEESGVARYADPVTGTVDIEGLRQAIGDFVDGGIGISLLRDVIDAFVTGDPVT